jgi:hypothetical protein
MPANAPKPTALTNRIATMTGWKVRNEWQRQEHADRRRNDRDLQAFEHAIVEQRHLVGGDIGRQHARDETGALIEANEEALPTDVDDGRGVEHIGCER